MKPKDGPLLSKNAFKKTNNYGNFSTLVGSLAPSTLIVYQEFLISCLMSLITTELITAISLFWISGQVYIAFRRIIHVNADYFQ